MISENLIVGNPWYWQKSNFDLNIFWELYLLQRCQVWWSCRTLEVPECWIGYLSAFDGWDVFSIPIHLQICTKIQNGWFRNSMWVFVRLNFFFLIQSKHVQWPQDVCVKETWRHFGPTCPTTWTKKSATARGDFAFGMASRWDALEIFGEMVLRDGWVPKIEELVDQLGYTSSDSIILTILKCT